MFSSFVLSRRLTSILLSFALATLAPAQSVVAWGGVGAGDAPPSGLSDVGQIAAGSAHSLALKSDRTVAAWGSNAYGQTAVPSGLTGVVAISGGNLHSLALKSDGTVVGWGSNAFGQATPPPGLSGVAGISAGINHSLALKANGTVVAWGSNTYLQRNVPGGLSGVAQVAAGGFFSLVLKSDGTVVGWGDNDQGQSAPPEGLSGVVQIAAGVYHALALKSDGTVVAWGSNGDGQRNVPLGLSNVVQVAAGNGFSVALKSDGTVVAWGRNASGERNVPANLPPVARLSVGLTRTVALLSLGVEIDRKELYSGEVATGTVSLADAAGAGGATVALSSESSAVGVPASLMVPEGARTATFPLSTSLIFSDIPAARISAALAGRTGGTSLKVNRNTATLKASHAAVTGGSTVKPTLTLTLAWAPVSDATLELSADSSLGLPASVTVPEGQTSVKLAFTHDRVTTDTARPISALYAGSKVAETSVTIRAIRGTLSFAEPILTGGQTTTGYLFLTDPIREAITIPLMSGDSSVTLPASIRIGAGARQALFSIATTELSATKNVRVTATANGNPIFATLRVNTIPAVSSIAFPSSIYGRSVVTGTVRLKTAALPGGTSVQLESTDSGFIVPAQVIVPEGQYAVGFQASVTGDPPSDAGVTVTATSGSSSVATTATVKRLTIASLTLSASKVQGGNSLSGTVALNAIVTFDTEVAVTSADPTLASVPTVVTVPAGSKSATFPIETSLPMAAKLVKITAAKNGSSLYRTLKVTP